MVSWDPFSFYLVSFLTCGGILLTSYYLETKRQINLLNVYRPCVERKHFWERMESSGLLSLKNIIIAGDLNLTLSIGEIWGHATALRSMEFFFHYFVSKK